MVQSRNKYQTGFTLIELMIVIATIGLLASIVLTNVSTARSRARDAKRKADLEQIYNAMELYATDNGSYHIPGTGSGGCGCGLFSYSDGTPTGYTVSIAQGLVNAQEVSSIIVDPSGVKLYGTQVGHQGYMLYPCGNGFYVYASLENPTAQDLASYANASAVCTATAATPGIINYAIGHK